MDYTSEAGLRESLTDENARLKDEMARMKDRNEDEIAILKDKMARMKDDHLAQLDIQSASSRASTKKQKKQISWSAVIDPIKGLDKVDKQQVIKDLTKLSADPANFMAQMDFAKEVFCEQAGITGWSEQICDLIKKVFADAYLLPSPSNTKWADVHRFVEGELPDSVPLPLQQTRKLSDAYKYFRNVLRGQVQCVSEMETTARVLLVILEAIGDDSTVWLELQPSLVSHSAFTDFYFVLKNEQKPLLLIEVKKNDVSTLLTPGSDVTAQILREVHIVLCESCSVSQLPFILTNSRIWSFGLAARFSSEKINIDKIHTLLSNGIEDEGRLISNLKHVLQNQKRLILEM